MRGPLRIPLDFSTYRIDLVREHPAIAESCLPFHHGSDNHSTPHAGVLENKKKNNPVASNCWVRVFEDRAAGGPKIAQEIQVGQLPEIGLPVFFLFVIQYFSSNRAIREEIEHETQRPRQKVIALPGSSFLSGIGGVA